MMTPEQLRQAEELKAVQSSYYNGWNKYDGMASNPGEGSPSGSYSANAASNENGQEAHVAPVTDPMIVQGIYAPSGIDMMKILVAIHCRSNPIINLGPIDDSVALVLCDPSLPDMPIVYCSRGFENMTGYTESQVKGINCRFLQNRYPSWPKLDSKQRKLNEEATKQLRHEISREREVQVKIMNYRKDGSIFPNVLTIIPVVYEGKKYCVGLQHDISGDYWRR